MVLVKNLLSEDELSLSICINGYWLFVESKVRFLSTFSSIAFKAYPSQEYMSIFVGFAT